MSGQAVETAAPAGPMEDLPLRLERWPRRLGHLPTVLPQDLGKRCADSAFPTAAWETLRRLRVSHKFPQPRRRRALTWCLRKWGSFRYTKRAALAEYRITHYDGETIRFAYKDYAKEGRTSYKTLRVFAFIGRLIRHIPDKHFKMVRYAGIFATRWKALYLTQARAALGLPSTSTTETPTSLLPWRERRLAEQGVDPLVCLKCQVPMILIGVIFGAHEHVAEYFEAAGFPRAPTHPAWDTG